MDDGSMDEETITRAVAAARRGRLIVMPTDTVYGIATRPDDHEATARLFEAKGRPRRLTLPVLVASTDEARRIAVFDDRAARLAAAFWPGALTLVLRRTEASRGWDLGGDGSSIGVRVPDHPLAIELLGLAGPLAVTSANRSGDPPAGDREELEAAFGDAVAVYVAANGRIAGVASTVVDLTAREPSILRPGDVDPAQILALAD
jgi:tRNA threonylcarbamoyl adenosine modification protein (Sua5/YciO/YrdC/YwlC family)